MTDFNLHVKKWILLDNEISIENEKLKELRNKRSEVHQEIIKHIQNEKLEKSTIEISDSKLKFGITKTSNPLSLKYVESCLNSVISNKEDVVKIMNIIKSNRISKEVFEMKRYINN